MIFMKQIKKRMRNDMRKSTVILSIVTALSLGWGVVETYSAGNTVNLQNQLDQANAKIKEVSANYDSVQKSFTKLAAEKANLTSDLSTTKNQLTQTETDLQKAEGNYKQQQDEAFKDGVKAGYAVGIKAGAANINNYQQQLQNEDLNRIANDLDAARWGWNK